ncbi:MAG: prepilin-type N-terminal cleavage/methylation domain-containing protein [Candidatus Moranbacteria bacterium]|nr:prepilin-type N-terminal cleavage/methylation domain-containing protein [Candidatus Moranbacteria bacterium]
MKTQILKKTRKGFTLIEVVAVMGIITVMMMATLVFMGQSRTDKELDAAANNVYASIREAQNYSLTGESVYSINSECNRIKFSYQNSDNSTMIQNTKESGEACTDALSEYTLENLVVFSNSGSISFVIPSGKSDVSGIYSITLSKKNRFYNVCVYPGGVISTISNAACPVNP